MYLSELEEIVEELKTKYGEDYNPEIEVHYQPNYPLKGILENARVLNGKFVIAAGAGTEYGSYNAWKNEYEDDVD